MFAFFICFIAGKPIFSVDIHPKGRRFATGGQGGDSGRVVVWNLEPVLSEKAELNSIVPKMLCQMDNHLGMDGIVQDFCKFSIFCFVMYSVREYRPLELRGAPFGLRG